MAALGIKTRNIKGFSPVREYDCSASSRA